MPIKRARGKRRRMERERESVAESISYPFMYFTLGQRICCPAFYCFRHEGEKASRQGNFDVAFFDLTMQLCLRVHGTVNLVASPVWDGLSATGREGKEEEFDGIMRGLPSLASCTLYSIDFGYEIERDI